MEGRSHIVVIKGAGGAVNASVDEGAADTGAKCTPPFCMVGGGGAVKETSSSLLPSFLGLTGSLVIVCMAGRGGAVRESTSISIPGT
jgi:hypothetical protein